MAHRVQTVLSQLKGDHDGSSFGVLKRDLMLQSLRAQFILSPARLKEMSLFMLHEMHMGLQDQSRSTLRMLPSYVYKRDPRQANGAMYALDLGGSNFRVIRMHLEHGKVRSVTSQKFAIPQARMVGKGEELFDFIAESIDTFFQGHGFSAEKSQDLPLGFTFSFPVQQLKINSGTLIQWTKEFKASGVEGNDVVPLLKVAMLKWGIKLNVVALCNDTVGTLVTQYFADDTTEMGVILGTGSNACYWERASAVTKDPTVKRLGDKVDVIINMEFGNFDSTNCLTIPLTAYDDALDAASENKGAQRFEKMISGKYLGELSRRVLLNLAEANVLPKTFAESPTLSKPYNFGSDIAGMCVADKHPGLPMIDAYFKQLGLATTSEDRLVVREVCELVCRRAAQLAGMAIAATLLKHGKQYNATVAVDGSVYEKQPGFRAAMQRAIAAVLGDAAGVRTVLTRDGSGVGAGLIAALQVV